VRAKQKKEFQFDLSFLRQVDASEDVWGNVSLYVRAFFLSLPVICLWMVTGMHFEEVFW
jgi:hypothetical protein